MNVKSLQALSNLFLPPVRSLTVLVLGSKPGGPLGRHVLKLGVS